MSALRWISRVAVVVTTALSVWRLWKAWKARPMDDTSAGAQQSA